MKAKHDKNLVNAIETRNFLDHSYE